ncbi:hypothetical protein DQF30_23690, partial [Shigella flexneri]|nr:hypothetical protein [Shigella flexneri]
PRVGGGSRGDRRADWSWWPQQCQRDGKANGNIMPEGDSFEREADQRIKARGPALTSHNGARTLAR